jgi:hypothetical protein
LTVARFVDLSVDAGFVPVVSVGDVVWEDVDGDGVQDVGEGPLAGVVLVVTDLDGLPVVDVFGVPVGPQVSGVDGSYGFVDLPPGSYRVVASAPDGWVATGPVVDVSAPLLWAGAVDPTLDFGFRRVPEPEPEPESGVDPGSESSMTVPSSSTSVPAVPSSSSGVVSGVVSVGGVGVSGVVVAVGDVASVVTSGDGGFSVSGVPVGRVPVVVTPPPGVDPGSVDVVVDGVPCVPCVVEVRAGVLPSTGSSAPVQVFVLVVALGALAAVTARGRTHT